MVFLMLLMVLLVLFVLFLFTTVFQCFNFLSDLLHFKWVLKHLMSSLKLLLLNIYHGIFHHPQKCLILTSSERIVRLLWLKSRLLLTLLFRQAFNCLSKQKAFRVLLILGLLLGGSAVLVHPVEPLERTLWYNTLLDLYELKVFNLFLFFQLLYTISMPLFLLFFLRFSQPYFFYVLERRGMP